MVPLSISSCFINVRFSFRRIGPGRGRATARAVHSGSAERGPGGLFHPAEHGDASDVGVRRRVRLRVLVPGHRRAGSECSKPADSRLRGQGNPNLLLLVSPEDAYFGRIFV